jgi:cell division protein FtsB
MSTEKQPASLLQVLLSASGVIITVLGAAFSLWGQFQVQRTEVSTLKENNIALKEEVKQLRQDMAEDRKQNRNDIQSVANGVNQLNVSVGRLTK